MITRDPPRMQSRSRLPLRPQEHAIPASPTARCFTSDELFAGESEIAITHEGSVYRMKITRQGKLILNK